MARNIPTELILLEIASGLKNLIEDPNLDEAIKSAYALTEAEKAEAEQAHAIIAKSKEFLDDIEKQRALYANTEERIKEAEEAEKSNIILAKELMAKKEEIERLIVDGDKKLQEISDANMALEERENAVMEKENTNKLKEDRLNAFEAKLLGTASILSNTVQGLSA